MSARDYHGDEPFIAAEQRRAECAVRAFIADPDQFDKPVQLPVDLKRIDEAAVEVCRAKARIRNGSPIGYDEIAGTIVEFGDEIYAALVFYRNNANKVTS